MRAERVVARRLAAPDRRPPTLAPRAPSVTAVPAGQLLQRRLGNQGTAAFLARSAATPRVSSPTDASEREATAVAAHVMRMPAPPTVAPGGAGVQRSPLTPAAGPGSEAPPGLDAALRGGVPLAPGVRRFMEERFRRSFSDVRVHDDLRAASLSDALHANAFTVGTHVFFARGQYRPDDAHGRELIAHELTHVVQHRGGDDRQIRREERKGWWSELTEFGEEVGWRLVREHAPALEPVLRKGVGGVFDWLTERVGAALQAVVSAAMAGVRGITGIGQRLMAHVAPLLASIRTAAVQIAHNDCTPLREAAERIQHVAESLVTPIVERLQPVVARVERFVQRVWDTFGAPTWEWMKSVAAAGWAGIQAVAEGLRRVGTWIWEKTAWARSLAGEAWDWLKKKLGVDGTAAGGDGLFAWMQRKIDAAWTWVKGKIGPFATRIQGTLLALTGVVAMLSPAGPVLAVAAAVTGAVQGLRWIHANWGKGNVVVQARAYIQTTLVPSLVGAARRLGGAVRGAATALARGLGGLAASLSRAVGGLADSVLGFAASAVQWVADQATGLASWATEHMQGLAEAVGAAVHRLETFLHGVGEFLAKVGRVVLDVWGLPFLLAEKVWSWVPACIRNPIVDFLVPIILRQVELFQELVRDDEAWQRTKAAVGRIVRLVFKDHDLMGAVKATFLLILRVFNVPPDLVATVVQKAAAAWDVVVKRPLVFIKNTVRALGHGFRRLWANIRGHLAYGLEGWLFSALGDKGVRPPASWTDPTAVFGFVLSVLGLSVDHLWQLLEKRLDPAKVQRMRSLLGRAATALAWVRSLIDTSKSPAENAHALVERAREFGSTILTGVTEWIVGRVAAEVELLAAAAAATGGLSEVIDIVRRVYKAILTAARWARRILDMANEALDHVSELAGGAVEAVGVIFESIMHRGMPVVIGFLADQVGLGGVPAALTGIVMRLRAKVDAAILWVIDRVVAGLQAIAGAVKAGVASVLEWWRMRRRFRMGGKEDHELSFAGAEADAELMIASTPVPLTAFLAEYEKRKLSAAEQAAILAIRTEIGEIVKLKWTERGGARVDQAMSERRGREIRDHFEKLVGLLQTLTPGTTLPRTVVKWPRYGQMDANPLSVDPGGFAGSEPRGSSPLWEKVRQRKWKRVPPERSTTIYVRGHLLNHHLHGTGQPENWVPITSTANTQMEAWVESHLKNAVMSERRVFSYEVEAGETGPSGGRARWPDGTTPEDALPKRITFIVEELGLDGKPLAGRGKFGFAIENVLPPVDATTIDAPAK
jgi:hypothetical protein